MAEAPMIKTYRSCATGLILSLCNEIKLVEYINHAVTWDLASMEFLCVVL